MAVPGINDMGGAAAGQTPMDFMAGGVECIAGGIRVRITATENRYVDLIARPLRGGSVQLSLKLNPDNAEFVDLVGNGPSTNNHLAGYGRLLVNVAIDLMRRYYAGVDGVVVRGLVSDAGNGDTKDDIARRARFWMDTGMVLEQPELPVTKMAANLDDLQLRLSGSANSVCGYRHIPISDFWRPEVAHSLLNSLEEINITQRLLNAAKSADAGIESIKMLRGRIKSTGAVAVAISAAVFLMLFNAYGAQPWLMTLAVILLVFSAASVLTTTIKGRQQIKEDAVSAEQLHDLVRRIKADADALIGNAEWTETYRKLTKRIPGANATQSGAITDDSLAELVNAERVLSSWY